MSPPRVRAAVIGAGAWARTCHLPVLRSRPEVDIVAVSDIDPERVRAAADEFGVPKAFTDWRQTFAEAPDVCVIASPAIAHYAQARAALEAGAHVLVEKPMVLRHAEAAALVELAGVVGRQVIVSFGWNYSGVYAAARTLLADPGIGRVEHVLVHMASGTRELLTGASLSSTGFDDVPVVTQTWTDPRVSGGGYGQAQLPHALGVTLGLLGGESVVEATAVASPPQGSVETCLAVSGRLTGGGSIAVSGASFHAGLAANRHQLEIRLFGSEGNLLVDFERDELRLARPDGVWEVPLEPGAGRYDGRGPAAALVDVALGRLAEPPSPGELGCRTVEALERVYESLNRSQSGNVAS
jgi:predicted dehydrogenase